MTDWWGALESELERRGDVAPDPWAAVEASTADVALTPAQRAFLEQVTSIPVHGVDDDHDVSNFDAADVAAAPLDDEPI